MNEELTNDEVEIDLVDLGYVLLDKWRYLLISLIAGAVLLGAYSFFFIAPTYESTAKLYVVSASDDSVVNLSDLNLAQRTLDKAGKNVSYKGYYCCHNGIRQLG